MKQKLFIISVIFILLWTSPAKADRLRPDDRHGPQHKSIEIADSLSPLISFHSWTPLLVPKPHPSLTRLSEDDYQHAADRLGVEVAVIKAVIEVEAGPAAKGFSEEGMPIINFDMTLFKKFTRSAGIKLSRYRKSNPEVFSALKVRKYGTIQKAQWARLRSAVEIDSVTAYRSTFWGMFQIGGFNWAKCGCASVDEFVDKMSTSESEQLELFVNYIVSRELDGFLKAKNWAGFAMRYNGKQYAKRGYNKKLARAYRKFASKK